MIDTTEGWMALYRILDSAFAKFANERRDHGNPFPDNFSDEWNARLGSLGMTLTVYSPWRGTRGPTDPEGTITVSNPAGGCVQMPIDTAMKILTLGMT